MSSNPIEVAPKADADLILSARGGDDAAFSELYHRHLGAARAAARSLVRSRSDADDLVSEAFTRVLRALRKGGGPEVAFRPYLLTAVRNAFYDRSRKDGRVEVRDEVPEDLDAVLVARAAMAGEDKELVARAFANLPERWQTVLWHTEVEGRPPAEVAPMLGIAPNAVAALAYRAREGLREAYLQAHLQIEPPAGCKETRGRLGGYVRDSLSNRDRAKVEEHLDGCVPCKAVLVELREVSGTLRSALPPVLLGVPAATYLHHLAAAGAGKGLLLLFRGRPRGQQAAVGGGVVAAGVAVAVAVAALTGGDKPTTIVADTSIVVTTTAASSTTLARITTTVAKATSTTRAATTTTTRPGTTTTVAGTTTTTVAATTTTGAGTTSSTAPLSSVVTTAPAPITAAPPDPTTTGVPTPKRAALSVAGSPLGPVVANRSAFVSVSVSNAGPDPAVNTRANITLPSGFTFTGSQGEGWSCRASGPSVSCVRGSLGASASSSLLLQTQVGVGVTGAPSVGVSVSSDAAAGGASSASVGLGSVQGNGPAPLYASVTRGDIVTVGNTLRTCDGCATPFDGTGDNGSTPMVAIDVDGDSSTTASSSATLSLPPGATVNRAWLVWGATTGVNGDTISAANYGSVRLNGPVTSAPYFVVATSTTPTAPTDVYGRADVTELVRGNGSGVYTFGSLGGYNEAAAKNRSGGWSLVVQYNRPSDPLRTLVVLDGMVLVSASHPTENVALGVLGANVPVTGVGAKVGLVAWDGDRGSADSATFTSGASGTAVALTDADNPADDVFNSTVSGAGRDPASTNTLGFDADTFAVTVYGGGPLSLEVSSPSDAIRLGVITLSVPV